MNRTGESFYDIYLRNEAEKGRQVPKINITKFMSNYKTPEEQKHGLKGNMLNSSRQGDGSGFHQGSVNNVFCSSGFGTPH